MPLSLEYPDKYRLWADLIQGHHDRVFVAAREAPGLGALVPVKLVLPGVQPQLAIEGLVIGLRAGSARFPAGVYLRFGDEQIDKCRRLLGLSQSPERYHQGRKSRRIRCELKVGFTGPRAATPGMAKNVSRTGMLVISPVELSVGQRVQAAILPGDGEPIPFQAEVSWARNDRRLVGLRFLELAPRAQERLDGILARLEKKLAELPRQPQLLVADDEPHIVEFLTKALNKHGYAVREALQGEEALDKIRELRPQLVIMDILMPGIDGVDICKMMRADVELAEIPVIFLSALEEGRLHALADEAGATDFMGKPVNLADLINMVGRYLKR